MSTPSHPPRRRPAGIRRPRVAGRTTSRTVRETGGVDLFGTAVDPVAEEAVDADLVEGEPDGAGAPLDDEPTDRGVELPPAGTGSAWADESTDRHVDLPRAGAAGSADELTDRHADLPPAGAAGPADDARLAEAVDAAGPPDGAGDELPPAARSEAASGDRSRRVGPAERADGATADRPTGKRSRPVPRVVGIGRRSWRMPTGALAVVAVVLAVAATVFGIEAAQLRGEPSARNTALVDVGATAQVGQQVSDALTKIYSFDYTRLDQNEAAARAVITPAFDEQFATLFKQVRQLAPAQKAVVTATVTMSGVRSIDGDTAQVLVFLDQQATRAADGGQPQQLAAAGRLSVTAQNVDGVWKIAGVTPQ